MRKRRYKECYKGSHRPRHVAPRRAIDMPLKEPVDRDIPGCLVSFGRGGGMKQHTTRGRIPANQSSSCAVHGYDWSKRCLGGDIPPIGIEVTVRETSNFCKRPENILEYHEKY